jgi:hypothetical protein
MRTRLSCYGFSAVSRELSTLLNPYPVILNPGLRYELQIMRRSRKRR